MVHAQQMSITCTHVVLVGSFEVAPPNALETVEIHLPQEGVPMVLLKGEPKDAQKR